MAKTYWDYVNAGICPTCKSKPANGKTVLCDSCHALRMTPERKAKQLQLSKKYKENNRAKGLCDRCKNEAVPGRKECQKCIDRKTEYVDERRKAIFDLYGNKCACCGEDRWEFLTIDHVNGNGSEERRNGFKLQHLRTKLLKDGRANPDYQILCMNCNFSKGMRGYCPHEKETK